MRTWARLLSGLFLCSAADGFRAAGVPAGVSKAVSMSVDTSQFVGLAECPRLGLGLAALGRPGYINLGRDNEVGDKETRSVDAMREQSFKVLDAAWRSGIRYFDAARSYGMSEAFLQGWLESRNIAPEDVAVGSKWGYRYIGCPALCDREYPAAGAPQRTEGGGAGKGGWAGEMRLGIR